MKAPPRSGVPEERISPPIITAVGAGTNYPCIRPAPYIVSENRGGVDVVTVVTEAPLSYSGLLLKRLRKKRESCLSGTIRSPSGKSAESAWAACGTA